MLYTKKCSSLDDIDIFNKLEIIAYDIKIDYQKKNVWQKQSTL